MLYEKTIDLYGDGIGKVQYIDHMGTDLTIVNSARVSFGVEKEELNDKDKKLINYLVKHKHTSTFEHNVVTFKFIVPLFVRSQHMRHRTWSYNEISRRYTDKDLAFYSPKSFRTQHKSNRQSSNQDEINPILYPDLSDTNFGIKINQVLESHNKRCLDLFNHMMTSGVCREQARMVLPQNLYTEYYGTVNLSNLLKFISLRTHEGAQWEIQKVALACLEIAAELWPCAVDGFRNQVSV
jgi:thymidylate synthase (FAD)